MLLPNPIELFYPGTHTDFRGKTVTVGRVQLQSAVDWFNRSGQRLPLVVGHPDSEEVQFGAATRLEMLGDRVTIAEVEGLDPTFRMIVNSGELSRLSAKIRLPGHPKNRSGGIEFQHAGFFGKSRVALDRLKEASFSLDDQEFWCMEDDSGVASALQDRDLELTRREAEFEREVAAFRRIQQIEPELEALVREGKILPGEKAGLVALFGGMPDDFEIAFAAPSGEVTQSGTEFLRSFLGALSPRVVYGEVTRTKEEDRSVSFSAPGAVDSDGLEQLTKLAAAGVDLSNPAAIARALLEG